MPIQGRPPMEVYDDEYQPYSCRHGIEGHCEDCSEDCEDIDKCLTCGKYKSSSQLDRYQNCKSGCVNPNEY